MFLVLEGAVVLHSGPALAAESGRGTLQQPVVQGGNVEGKAGGVELAAGERIAGKGDVFGESGLFPEELGAHRLESARTLSFVSAFVLTAAAMREIKEEYPAVRCVAFMFCCCCCCVRLHGDYVLLVTILLHSTDSHHLSWFNGLQYCNSASNLKKVTMEASTSIED